LLAFAFISGLILAPAQGAIATCHSFKISVSPEAITEGSNVSVAVERNAALSPSSVQVISIEENATSGVDFDRVDRRVEFTTETRETFTVTTKDDSSSEITESFVLKAGNASGCEIKQEDFRYGTVARVSILDNDSTPAGVADQPGNLRATPQDSSSSSPVSGLPDLSPTEQQLAETNEVTSTSTDPSYLPSEFPFAVRPTSGGPLTRRMIAIGLAFGAAAGIVIAWWIWRKALPS
jgi:hypothetical protein